MSNHGPHPFENFDDKEPGFQKRQEIMREFLDTTGFRGAVDAFPEGKLQDDDEGAIQFAVGESHGKVVIDFGTSVHWLGMTPHQAADFASSVLKKTREVGRKQGQTITMKIG